MFTLVVTEGQLEVTAGEKLLDALGVDRRSTRFIPKGGYEIFWREIPRYNQAARFCAVLGLADLEQNPCASGLIAKHLPHGREPAFVLRIAKRMLESWLLADRAALAEFLRVAQKHIPADPETEWFYVACVKREGQS
jgi:hypothetical protein